MNSATLRRLVADHAALHKIDLPPYYLHCVGASLPDDLTQLTVLVAGPSGTPYEKGLWKLHLRIPIDYPNSPPKASFRTKIFHPNVEEATGAVCLDTLKRDWSSQLTLRDILITISCLLINPNPDSALNASAGKLIQEDFDAFAKKARLMTSIHACIPFEFRNAVQEAITRGEDKEVTDDEYIYGDEASESKENDPSISPSPVSPTKPVQRSVLGKRPLADLPTPTEPDEEETPMTNSEMNIVANTPNLSTDMSSLSFTAGSSASTLQPPRRIARPHDWNRAAPSPRVFTFTGIATSSNAEPHHSFSPQPSAKRARTIDGKENEGVFQILEDNDRSSKIIKTNLTSTSFVSPPLGLGVRLGNVPFSATAASKAKSKARIGIRRL